MPGSGRRAPNGACCRVRAARGGDPHHVAAAVRRAMRGTLRVQRDRRVRLVGRATVGDLRCLRCRYRRQGQCHRQREEKAAGTAAAIDMARVVMHDAVKTADGGVGYRQRPQVPTRQGVTKARGGDSLGWEWLPATPRPSTITCITSGGGGLCLGLEGEATDAEVVRAVLAGDVERYAVLVRRYRERYARYASRMLGSRDVAEDAVQDALVRAFDRLADCREPDKFAGWLFLILRNRCYAEQRRRQREGRPLDEADEMFAAPDRPDGAYEQVERTHALERALQHLTAEQREVFVLKHTEGLAYEEIAGVTGATVASLKMRMHRAYDRLRELMKEHLE